MDGNNLTGVVTKIRGVDDKSAGCSYEIVWSGRGCLTSWPERDYRDTDFERVVYWAPPLMFSWSEFRTRGGWALTDPSCRAMWAWRNRRLRSGRANRVVEMRLRKGHRSQHLLIGERATSAKLREEQVLDIRRLHHHNGRSFNKIAKLYNISTPTVAQIIKGVTWRHLPLIPEAEESTQ